MIVSLLQRILSQLKELAGNIGGAIKNILYDSYMTEEQLLAKLVENPDIDMNGFFYNSDIGEYCSFSGLYMSKIVSGEEVHYGYCEIRGVHDSEYLVDYRIDWEDSANWYKVDMVTHNDLISYTKLGIVGDAYDSTKTYNAGDYCIYNNVNYKKLGASEYGVTPTDDGVHWKAININNEVSELNSNLFEVTDKVSSNFVSGSEATTGSNITLTFSNLKHIPKETYIIWEEMQWINPANVTYSISGNSVTVTFAPCFVVGAQYARISGRLLYR